MPLLTNFIFRNERFSVTIETQTLTSSNSLFEEEILFMPVTKAPIPTDLDLLNIYITSLGTSILLLKQVQISYVPYIMYIVPSAPSLGAFCRCEIFLSQSTKVQKCFNIALSCV